MIKHQESIRNLLLKGLLDLGPSGGTRQDILEQVGLGSASFYREMPDLLTDQTVEHVGDRYRLPMKLLHNYRFKLWQDAEKLRQRPPEVRSLVQQIVQQATEKLGDSLLALWLTGSTAHGTQTETSDLDFLAITRRQSDFAPEVPHRIQFIGMTPAQFQRKLEDGDSFCLATLRYGLLLEDRGVARKWLDWTVPLRLDSSGLAEILANHRHKAYLFRRIRSTEEEHEAVATYATSLGRALLAVYGELPAGKPAMLELLDLYFGSALTRRFSQVLESGRIYDANWLTGLEALAENFQVHQLRFSSLSRFLYSQGLQFEAYCHDMLQSLTQGKFIRSEADKGFAVLSYSSHELRVACKSTFQTNALPAVTSFRSKLSRSVSSAAALLIFNPSNKVTPSLRDWSYANEQVTTARGVVNLVTSKQLLAAYNQWLLLDEVHLPDFLIP